MTAETVKRMPWTDQFHINHGLCEVSVVETPGEDASTTCNAAFSSLIDACIEKRTFDNIGGVHSEPISIPGAHYPVQLERFAAPVFGTANRGAHLTIYARTASGIKIWVPRRSAHLRTYPGMLDSSVAGGVRAGESPLQNIVHEAAEEASVPEAVVRQGVRSTGVLTTMGITGRGAAQAGLVFPDVLYTFDLEVDEAFVARPRDDEVKEFYLLAVEEVKERLLGWEFKNNSAVVMIDFFIRHGIITPDEPGYVEMVGRMHRKLPVPLSPRRVLED